MERYETPLFRDAERFVRRRLRKGLWVLAWVGVGLLVLLFLVLAAAHSGGSLRRATPRGFVQPGK